MKIKNLKLILLTSWIGFGIIGAGLALAFYYPIDWSQGWSSTKYPPMPWLGYIQEKDITTHSVNLKGYVPEAPPGCNEVVDPFFLTSGCLNLSDPAFKYRVKGTLNWDEVPAHSIIPSAPNPNAAFSAEITGLSSCTEYEVEAVVSNSIGRSDTWWTEIDPEFMASLPREMTSRDTFKTLCEPCPACPPPALPTVDLKANNSDGPITLYYRDSVALSWTS